MRVTDGTKPPSFSPVVSVAGSSDGLSLEESGMGSDDRTSGLKPPGASGGEGLNPGDDAKAGTPGTGENICRACKGTGQFEAKPCPTCGGTGKVVEGMGGG